MNELEKRVINKNASPRTAYKRLGDCCYGCPYRMCPSRPTRPFKMERPDCVWRMFSEKTKK